LVRRNRTRAQMLGGGITLWSSTVGKTSPLRKRRRKPQRELQLRRPQQEKKDVVRTAEATVQRRTNLKISDEIKEPHRMWVTSTLAQDVPLLVDVPLVDVDLS